MMTRLLFLIAASAVLLPAQMRWKCDPKDGKFTMTPCAHCQKFYCWDGQIFSNEPGYTPPPGYVLAYWKKIHHESQQMREDIERHGKELRQQFEQSKENTARLNQERLQASQQSMDDLHRRMAQSKSPPRSVAANSQRTASPRETILVSRDPISSAPPIPPVGRAKVGEVQVGMDRAAVEAILGKPHSSMSIPEDDGLVESLTYSLDDKGTARIRIQSGKVVSIKLE